MSVLRLRVTRCATGRSISHVTGCSSRGLSEILQREHRRAGRVRLSASILGPGPVPLCDSACSSLNEGDGANALFAVLFLGCISQGWMRQRESGDPEESKHLGGCSGPPSSQDLGPGPEGPPDTSVLGPDCWGTSSRRDQSLYLHHDFPVSLPDFLYFTNTSIALTACWMLFQTLCRYEL